MMDKIHNPKTNKWVNISGKTGKTVLTNYIKTLNMSGGVKKKKAKNSPAVAAAVAEATRVATAWRRAKEVVMDLPPWPITSKVKREAAESRAQALDAETTVAIANVAKTREAEVAAKAKAKAEAAAAKEKARRHMTAAVAGWAEAYGDVALQIPFLITTTAAKGGGVFERQAEVVESRPTYKKPGEEAFLFYVAGDAATDGYWMVGPDTSKAEGYWKVKSKAKTPGAINRESVWEHSPRLYSFYNVPAAKIVKATAAVKAAEAKWESVAAFQRSLKWTVEGLGAKIYADGRASMMDSGQTLPVRRRQVGSERLPMSGSVSLTTMGGNTGWSAFERPTFRVGGGMLVGLVDAKKPIDGVLWGSSEGNEGADTWMFDCMTGAIYVAGKKLDVPTARARFVGETQIITIEWDKKGVRFLVDGVERLPKQAWGSKPPKKGVRVVAAMNQYAQRAIIKI